MNRRRFIKTGLIWAPIVFSAGIHGSVQLAAIDPQVNNWMSRVVTNSGHYTSLSIVANDTWMKLVRSAGVRSLIRRANTETGLDLNAAVVPLIADLVTANDTAVSLVAGDYTEATGITPSASGYLDTGWSASTQMPGVNDGHLALYNRSNLIDANVVMGALNGGTQVDWMVIGNTGNLTSCSMHDAGAGALNFAGDTDPRGFYQIVRTASNDCQLYKNGVSVVTYAGASVGTLSTPTIFIGAYDNVTLGAAARSAKNHAGYSLGGGVGFTATACAAYRYAWQRLSTILSRQV